MPLGVVLLVLFASGTAGNFPVVDERTYSSLLSAGRIVLVERDKQGAVKMVTGAAIVNASPEETARVVADFESYPEWMPQTKKMTVQRRRGKVWETEYTLSFDFAVLSLDVQYTLEQKFNLPQGFTFRLIKGRLKEASGSWMFFPLEGGKRTAVFYSSLSDFRSLNRIVSAFLQQQPSMELAIWSSTVVLAVEAVKKRVEELKERGAIPVPTGWELIAPSSGALR